MITAKNVKEAWEIVDKMFPTDYIKDERSSENAGYDVYRSTVDGGFYNYICDLGNRLEVNFDDGKTINVWIVAVEKDEKSTQKNEMMLGLLRDLVDEYNDYSELVALCYSKRRDGKGFDEGTVQWNRGSLNKIEEHMEKLAKVLDKKIDYSFGSHSFGFDDWKRTLEYRTAHIA